MKDNFRWANLLATGASLGLAVLTKGTAYIFALPLILWFCVSCWRVSTSRLLKFVGVVAVIAITLNAGHYYRNYSVFGNPLSTDTTKLANEVITPMTITSNILRNIALNLSVPIEKVNNAVGMSVYTLQNSLGMDIHDPQITLGSGFGLNGKLFHEDYAGNPLHLLLIFVVLALVIFRKKLRMMPDLTALTASLIGAFFLFCALLKWQIWGTRLQLPLFVLWSSVIATVLSLCWHRALVPVALIMVLLALPWAVLNESRPLLGQSSIFNTTRLDQYFSSRQDIRGAYMTLAQNAVKTGCVNIALECNEDTYEYPLWVMISDKTGRMPSIHHVSVTNRSAKTGKKKPVTDCTLRL